MVGALGEVLPGVRQATVLDSVVTKERAATFRAVPGSAVHRAGTRTRIDGLYLAGAWTATGWPATMEGAVRSGYLAAQCVARVAGQRNAAFLVSDLPPSGFMRLFG
jgi:hydroxysqualene dehydroxylase